MTARLLENEKFSHPYDPYAIQLDLMKEIYSCIKSGCKVGLFESPTGTGKTLSLICSTMTWLRDFKRENVIKEKKVSGTTDIKEKDAGVKEDNDSDVESDDDEPAWVKEAYINSLVERSFSAAKEYELHLDEIEKKSKAKIQSIHELTVRKPKRFKKSGPKDIRHGEEEDSFIPDDYVSDTETSRSRDKSEELSLEVRKLLGKVDGPKETVELINNCPTTIYYTSRTHSQLSQFAAQLQMTSFPSSFQNLTERTKFLPLASRKQLCINPKVSKLKDLTSINDACIDMQNKSGSTSSCEFIPKLNNPESEELSKEFIDTNFASIHDIEDLVTIGESLHICPYYSVRRGIELSEITALPYQMLLQESTRQSLDINLDNAIVIIDEAHNLFDVISSLYSVSVSASDLTVAINSLKMYLKRFSTRLNSGNRINLMKLIKVCSLLKALIEGEKNVVPGKEMIASDIFKGSTGDSVNIHKIDAFLSKSKIAYKIEGWVQQQQQQQQQEDGRDNKQKSHSSSPLLFKIASFLRSLTNPSKEGKFFWDKSAQNIPSINYMLLDPSSMFKEIVTRAKCVILCGGTMEPMADYTNYLVPSIPQNQIRKFSCNHIIPDSNLQVYPISSITSTNSLPFEFSFDKRNNPVMISNLGKCVLKICQSVPDGVVMFFPSYKYLEQVLKSWKETNHGETYSSLTKSKSVFTEPRESSDTDKVLSSYASAIKEKHGALLLSVVGGKLSEGINFSDEMARAVIMVGLPFPNAFSGEIVAKRKYIESNVISKGGSNTMAREAAREFYENICMRAVNQSIGRSIRHINDYSILYLIDQRYGNTNIQKKLSGWVRNRLEKKEGGCVDFQKAISQTREFFERHKDRQLEI